LPPPPRRGGGPAAPPTALTLAACANDGATSDSSDTPAKAGQVTTITFWNGFTGPDGDALKDRIAVFNETHTDVQVDMTIMAWDVLTQKLLPALGSGEGPDISVDGVEAIPAKAEIGAFGPVDEYYERWDEAGALFESLAAATEFGGKHYTVPMTYSPMLLYYNKTLFEEAGLDPEEPPATMEELREAALALTKDTDGDGEKDQYGFLMASYDGPQIWENLMWNGGGGTVSADGSKATLGDPASVAVVEEWVDLILDAGISPGGMIGSDADALFTSGKGAMILEGPWMSSGFEEGGIEFGVVPLPSGSEAAYTISNSSEFFVSNDALADDARREAVWTFFDFWNSKDNQIAWATASGNPPTRSDITEAELADNPYVGLFNANRGDKGRFFLANVLPVAEVRGIYESTMQKVTSGAGSVADVMTEASAEIQALLDE
jgi:multiple sugar transport system substrate-binding protein